MTADTDTGAGLEVWGNLALQLGRVADGLERQRQDIAAFQRMHTVPVTAPQIPLAGGAGILDVPDVLGPKKGLAWALHWITAASFTAGTVSVYIGPVADQNLRFVFTQAGVWEPPRTATILLGGDRLVFVAAGIVGNVTISGQASEMVLAELPGFLRLWDSPRSGSR